LNTKKSKSNLVTNKHDTKVLKTPKNATGKNPNNNYLLVPKLERRPEERQIHRMATRGKKRNTDRWNNGCPKELPIKLHDQGGRDITARMNSGL